MRRALVTVVGCGMGRPALSAEAARAVADANLLCGGKRLLAFFTDHPGRRLPIAGPLASVCDAIADACAAGEDVVVLADGDPLFFGIGRTLLERFGAEALRFFPGATAVAAAAALMGRTWHDLPAVSLHGRDDMTPLYAALVRCGCVAVYTDARNTPRELAERLQRRGGDGFVMTVLEDMGLPGQRLRRLTLAEAAECMDVSPLNLVVIERTEPTAVPLAMGLADEALSRNDAVFTKAPVRAVSLSCLSPRPGQVVWDVGAGTGSVAIEASISCPGGPVFAVEREATRFALLEENIRRTGALTVAPVLGEAPEALAALPDPDRIFVGGGLRSRPELLEHLCDRLRPDGRLVVNAVLLGSLERAMDVLSRRGLRLSLTQLAAAQATPLAGDWRLAADNPVFIVTASRESHD